MEMCLSISKLILFIEECEMDRHVRFERESGLTGSSTSTSMTALLGFLAPLQLPAADMGRTLERSHGNRGQKQILVDSP